MQHIFRSQNMPFCNARDWFDYNHKETYAYCEKCSLRKSGECKCIKKAPFRPTIHSGYR